MMIHLSDFQSPWGSKKGPKDSSPSRDREGGRTFPPLPERDLETSAARRPRPSSDPLTFNKILAWFGAHFGGSAPNGRGKDPSGPSRRWLLIGGVVIGSVWLSSGLYLVEEGEQAAILRFGRFTELKGPGLHYHWPAPLESAFVASVSVINRIESGDRLGPRGEGDDVHMLTGDQNLVALSNYTVHWHIQDLRKFLFHSRSAESIIRAAADSALREIVAKTPMDMVVAEARERINQDTLALLQKLLDSYDLGVAINEFILQRADPPEAVMDAFRDVQRAKADQERARNEASAYRNDILPKARGQARQMILEAEGYHKSAIAKAEGDAGRFDLVLTEYRKAPEVTRNRMTLETMEDVLRRTSKVLVDPSVANVVPFLPLPGLKAGAATHTPLTQGDAP